MGDGVTDLGAAVDDANDHGVDVISVSMGWYNVTPGDGTGEFANAMIHFYRAEVTRANVWRQRLDATTNWAVIWCSAMWMVWRAWLH